jgi:predicted nucleic acid-binding protein
MPHAAQIPVYQLDANVLLRFLRNDHKDHSPRAGRFIQDANNGRMILEVSAVTVAEIFYALKAAYQVDRRTAAKTLAAVLNTPAFRLSEHLRVLDALARVQKANVDFGDAYLAATAAEAGIPVASFDHDLDRFADVTRHEP